MREIKFRVWNKIRKVMSYDVTLYANRWVECVYVDGTEDKFPSKIAKEILAIMQYIGLKDKNGKEIYEGDILSTDLSRPYLIVCFRNGAFMVQCHDNGKDYYDLMAPMDEESDQVEHLEVIGNIYENPELLGSFGGEK